MQVLNTQRHATDTDRDGGVEAPECGTGRVRFVLPRLGWVWHPRIRDFPWCHRRVSCDIDNINVRGNGWYIDHIALFLVGIRVSP